SIPSTERFQRFSQTANGPRPGAGRTSRDRVREFSIFDCRVSARAVQLSTRAVRFPPGKRSHVTTPTDCFAPADDLLVARLFDHSALTVEEDSHVSSRHSKGPTWFHAD